LGGRLFAAYRIGWWALLTLAVAAVAISWIDAVTPAGILLLRLAKALVLVAVSAILFRRRTRDPVAAMLSLAFLLWTVSSSVDLATASVWAAVIDRLRFLLFALALLLFPNGHWRPSWTRPIGVTVIATFMLGLAEAIGLVATHFYLPIAIGCVIAALASLRARFRATDADAERQQLKWVTLGLVAGISLILAARASAALTSGMPMPMIGAVAIEGLFQLGIIVLALGFLVSLLRFRLYDAEAAISRSAVYAVLTLSVVGSFAACEAVIELLGQRYLGSNIGTVSGTVAAAVAAAMLTPLHGRISHFVEGYFQRDLATLKRELPDLLVTLSAWISVKRLANAFLPHIEQAVQSTRTALIIDGRLTASQGIGLASARQLLKGWHPPAAGSKINRDDDASFPLSMALHCPFGSIRGWLLLGPRPDGSFYGRDELDALAEIGAPLQRALFSVVEREAEEKRRNAWQRNMSRTMASMAERLEILEQVELSSSGRPQIAGRK